MSSFIAVNYKEVEYHMDTNEVPLLVKELKFYRRNRLWHDVIGYKYCHGKCRFLHELMRRSKGETVLKVLQLLDKMIGRSKLVRELTLALDASGRSVLIVGAKHLESSILVNLIETYDLDVHLYSIICKMSILSYALKRRKHDLILTCVKRINARNYTEEQMVYYNRDLDLLRNYIEERTSIDLPLFEALTEEYGGGKRMYKITPPVSRPPRSFKQSRAWQLLRHMATQLFFRWRYFRKLRDLVDVQILCCERKEDPYFKPMLFVACTPCGVTKLIEDDFIAGCLYTMLTTTYVSEKDEIYTTDVSDDEKENESGEEGEGGGKGGEEGGKGGEGGGKNDTNKEQQGGEIAPNKAETNVKSEGKEKGEKETPEKEAKAKKNETAEKEAKTKKIGKVEKKKKRVKLKLPEDHEEESERIEKKEEEKEDDVVEHISHRISSKLRSRVWGKHRQNYSCKKSKDICQVLMRDMRIVQKVRYDHENKTLSMPLFNSKEGHIYLVNTSHGNTATQPQPAMHAEYLLTAIADHLKKTTNDLVTTIFGKGRPCLACSAPLRTSKIEHFNERQGLLSADGVHVLHNNVRFDCVSSLFERPSHVTQMTWKEDEKRETIHLPDYDSLSDSEPDESSRGRSKLVAKTRKRISKLNIKYKTQRIISDSYTQTYEDDFPKKSKKSGRSAKSARSTKSEKPAKNGPPCSLTSSAMTIWLCPSSKSIRDAKVQTSKKGEKGRKTPVGLSTAERLYEQLFQDQKQQEPPKLQQQQQHHGSFFPRSASAMPTGGRKYDNASDVDPTARSASAIISTYDRRYVVESDVSAIISRSHGVGEAARNASFIISSAERKYGSKASSRASSAASQRSSETRVLGRERADNIKRQFDDVSQPIRKSSAPPSSILRPLFRGDERKRCSSAPLMERPRTPTPIPFTQRSELPESCKSDCYDVFYM